jgi:hypothetical protein
VNITQKTDIRVRGENRNFTGIIRIWERVRPWSVSWIDYDGKVDIRVGRDTVAFIAVRYNFFLEM